MHRTTHHAWEIIHSIDCVVTRNYSRRGSTQYTTTLLLDDDHVHAIFSRNQSNLVPSSPLLLSPIPRPPKMHSHHSPRSPVHPFTPFTTPTPLTPVTPLIPLMVPLLFGLLPNHALRAFSLSPFSTCDLPILSTPPTPPTPTPTPTPRPRPGLEKLGLTFEAVFAK